MRAACMDCPPVDAPYAAAEAAFAQAKAYLSSRDAQHMSERKICSHRPAHHVFDGSSNSRVFLRRAPLAVDEEEPQSVHIGTDTRENEGETQACEENGRQGSVDLALDSLSRHSLTPFPERWFRMLASGCMCNFRPSLPFGVGPHWGSLNLEFPICLPPDGTLHTTKSREKTGTSLLTKSSSSSDRHRR